MSEGRIVHRTEEEFLQFEYDQFRDAGGRDSLFAVIKQLDDDALARLRAAYDASHANR